MGKSRFDVIPKQTPVNIYNHTQLPLSFWPENIHMHHPPD